MASILSLNDDCLRLILYFLDEPGSFYNVVSTCKRFLKVSKSTKNAVHPNVLRTKAEYYLKHHLVELAFPNCKGSVETREKRIDAQLRFSELNAVVCSALQLTEAKGLLSSPRIIDVWRKNGPVVTKLLTWMRNQETKQEKKKTFSHFYYDGKVCHVLFTTLRKGDGNQRIVHFRLREKV